MALHMYKSSQPSYPVISSRSEGLTGLVTVPGDKSISHRALILSSQAVGTSRIHGLLEGEDVINTAKSLIKLGTKVTKLSDGSWEVHGVGTGGFSEADDLLDMGNSGTGARLMMGLVATHSFTTFFTGDASLRSRPMARVTTPLEQMGASFIARSKGRLPLAVTGSQNPTPITYRLPVPSAQVKTAILLAGLNTPGKTTVIEPEATRNHTELMLSHMGAEVEEEILEGGVKSISILGQPELKPGEVTVPGDPSSAAFLAVAALITPNSQLTVENVCINPSRIGLYETLKEMGGNIEFRNVRTAGGEQVADIHVESSALKGVTVPAERAPSMIDEYPILSVAAAFAEGETHMQALAELRVKESDRLNAIALGLERCGIPLTIGEDFLKVSGCAGKVPGGGSIDTHMDHRIIMSFLVLGAASQKPVAIDGTEMADTSFPGFVALMNRLGAKVSDA